MTDESPPETDAVHPAEARPLEPRTQEQVGTAEKRQLDDAEPRSQRGLTIVLRNLFDVAVGTSVIAASIIGYVQWKAIRQANQVATASLQLAATAQNPKIEVSSIGTVEPPLRFGQMKTTVYLKNTGPTPAYDVRVNAFILAMPTKQSYSAKGGAPEIMLGQIGPGEARECFALSNALNQHFLTNTTIEAAVVLSVIVRFRNFVGDDLIQTACRAWNQADGSWEECVPTGRGGWVDVKQ